MAKHRQKNEPRSDRGQVESAAQPKPEPHHEDIAVLAYRLWEEAGCREGCAEDDWFRAEQILNEKKAVRLQKDPSVRASSAA